MFGVADVIWRTNDGVTIITASSVEASLFRSTNSRSGAFVNIFEIVKHWNKLTNLVIRNEKELYLGKCDYLRLNGSHQGTGTSNFPVRWHTIRRTSRRVLCRVRTHRRRDRTLSQFKYIYYFQLRLHYDNWICVPVIGSECVTGLATALVRTPGVGTVLLAQTGSLSALVNIFIQVIISKTILESKGKSIVKHYQHKSEDQILNGILLCSRSDKNRACWHIANSANRSIKRSGIQNNTWIKNEIITERIEAWAHTCPANRVHSSISSHSRLAPMV